MTTDWTVSRAGSNKHVERCRTIIHGKYPSKKFLLSVCGIHVADKDIEQSGFFAPPGSFVCSNRFKVTASWVLRRYVQSTWLVMVRNYSYETHTHLRLTLTSGNRNMNISSVQKIPSRNNNAV